LVEIRELIKTIGKEKAVLLSTHIMQEVQAMCSRVIIINNGQIVADDSIEHIQEVNTSQEILMVSFESDIEPAQLKALAKAKRVESMGAKRWKLSTDKPDELRREIMQWALQNNIHISSMQAETQSLEDVFRQLTK